MINKRLVKVDYSRDSLFDTMGLRRLKDSYMLKSEKSPQDRFSYVARALGSNPEHAQRLYDYASKHWLSFSTPILSYGNGKRALPISCYLSYIDDSAEGLVDALSEICWLSMAGGGVGIGIGIRSEDEKSVGVMPHLKVYEAASLAYRQGVTRRGSFAAYLPINHPNIVQFIDMRKPTGDPNQRCLELHHGINVTDDFMQLIERCMADDSVDDSWPLIDPHTGNTKATVSAKNLWESIIETRMRTGEPYLHFIDASNRGLPDFQKKLGLSVRQSNICTEITLATDAQRTAVCCLSSLNLEYWVDWKNNYQFYKDVAEMLDNALNVFIRKAPTQARRAVYSAIRERSIGIGALGFHALLQKNNVAFESNMAEAINKQIFKVIEENLKRVNSELATERGACPDGAGYGVRFSHMMAIAPNASSSIIMGNTSPSIEPFRANAYRQDTLSGLYLNKNKYLDVLLRERVTREGELEAVWNGIVSRGGSVQHLPILTSHEKTVFATFSEINQSWIVKMASDRQKYIDQAQSLNLAFSASASRLEVSNAHFKAWKLGLKTLYYCRSDKLYRGESMNTSVERVKHNPDSAADTVNSDPSVCVACEG